jgi:hypothetical protein
MNARDLVKSNLNDTRKSKTGRKTVGPSEPIVHNFRLYRQRSHLDSFIPDPLTFPANHQSFGPYILSETDMARLLDAARYLQASAGVYPNEIDRVPKRYAAG